MARATRDQKLETRSARATLRLNHEPYWRGIGRGLCLGYRKGSNGGKWIVRVYSGGKYHKAVIGQADDFRDPNGLDVLDYYQAQEKARKMADIKVKDEAGTPTPAYRVRDAMEDYLKWAEVNNKGSKDAYYKINAFIFPALGQVLVSDLTTARIRRWFLNLANRGARIRGKERKDDLTDPEILRKRKTTANRILAILKAALSRAWEDGRVQDDSSWRRVKKFKDVDSARLRHLSTAECERLINSADPEFRPLIQAGLHTGARYGSLIKLQVRDYHKDSGTVQLVGTKSGKSYHVPLTDEGQKFFEAIAAGRPGDEPLFLKDDKTPWGQSQQHRRIKEACELAKIDPPISFHDLRHSYGSILAQKGVPLQVIAEVMGHSDMRMTRKHYAHLQPDHIAETIRKHLPAFGKKHRNKVRAIR